MLLRSPNLVYSSHLNRECRKGSLSEFPRQENQAKVSGTNTLNYHTERLNILQVHV